MRGGRNVRSPRPSHRGAVDHQAAACYAAGSNTVGVGRTAAELLARLREGLTKIGSRATVAPLPEARLPGIITPAIAVAPVDADDLRVVIGAASEFGLALVPRGAGTQDTWGHPIQRPAVVVDMRRLTGLIAYTPGDLTLRARAGTTLREINTLLRPHGQFVPLEAPGPDATLGGLVAGDQCGPCRSAYGAPRDLILGLSVIDGSGRAFRTGGNVVKNVSGLDIGKLLIGSFGTLGFITEVACKVRPLPAVTAHWGLEWPQDQPALALFADGLGVAPAGVVLHGDGDGCRLILRLEGSGAEVGAQRSRLEAIAGRGRPLADAAEVFASLAATAAEPGAIRLRVSVGSDPRPVWEAASRCLPGCARTLWSGAGLLHLRWTAPDSADAASAGLRAFGLAAAAAEATVVVAECPSELRERAGLDPWGAAGPLAAVFDRIKGAFDPDRRMAPGRFVGRL